MSHANYLNEIAETIEKQAEKIELLIEAVDGLEDVDSCLELYRLFDMTFALHEAISSKAETMK